ncbi:MAG: hypothetical protein A4S12_07045 [Proteobacteria bacterium SG_bin5]|nr:phage tail protein [Sphingomonas sp.]OQW42089.1 MAG: hypothetical protein A4S12_07045 [Proteobacteria bacterium SG_bin5]
MIKLASLRAALQAALPALRVDPDRLAVFVDKGRTVARLTPALGYELRYECSLWLPEFVGGIDTVMVPLLLWLREHQPDLFQRFDRDDEAIVFAADILDPDRTNLLIRFELTEAVQLAARGDGSGWDITRPAEATMADEELRELLGFPPLTTGDSRFAGE